METTYDRPVKGKLMITLENGESWEATPADLDLKFDLVTRHEAYMAFDNALSEILRNAGLLPHGDTTDSQLNPLRFLVSQTVAHEDFDPADHADVAEIEQALRERAGVSNNAPDLALDGRRSLFSGPEVRS